MTDISDPELLELIIAADDEAFEKGGEPRDRQIPVLRRVLRELGHVSFILMSTGQDPLNDRILNLHRSLYRASDLAVGGLHGGISMFRDVFARVSIPLGYGTIRIDPLTLTDLSPAQIRWLCSRRADLHLFLDQFTDIFDFAGGIGNLAHYKRPPKEALERFCLAAFQLQAAAAALSVAFDFRGAVQSALIGAELALKAGLVADGADDKACAKHSHDLASAATAFSTTHPSFDLCRVLSTISRLPAYVHNRYSPSQPGRLETGRIVMGAQYIAGEVMRQITSYSIRSALTPPSERFYPDEQAGFFVPSSTTAIHADTSGDEEAAFAARFWDAD